MEAISFKRHEENPLDSLGIGRVAERKIEKFNETVVQVISDINKLAEGYPEVRFVNWEPISVQSPITGIIDPFYGFKIRLNISTFPTPYQEKVYECYFEYYIESKISRMRWYSKSGQEEMNKFGQMEEVKLAFKDWINQYCYRKDDQRRFRIKYM
jgi:hypothetical protein